MSFYESDDRSCLENMVQNTRNRNISLPFAGPVTLVERFYEATSEESTARPEKRIQSEKNLKISHRISEEKLNLIRVRHKKVRFAVK